MGSMMIESLRGLCGLLWMMAEEDQIDLGEFAPIVFGMAIGADRLIGVNVDHDVYDSNDYTLNRFIDDFGSELGA